MLFEKLDYVPTLYMYNITIEIAREIVNLTIYL